MNNAEPIAKPHDLKATFRKHVKQYRALLRWGVDKVFQDSSIEVLLFDVKRHIDNDENQQAEALLHELKAQINLLEAQYPDQKSEIEKELYSRIKQLETVIDDTPNIDQNNVHQHLQTLEIARVAIQNDDWLEAKSKISLVETQVLVSNISNDLTQNHSASEIEPVHETEDKPGPKLAANPKLKTEAAPTRSKSKPTPTPKLNQLGAIAASLHASTAKSMIGRLLKEKDLQKTFHTLDQTHADNLRIGFIATPEIINTQLAEFAKNKVSLQNNDSQFLLLRLPLSRELTVYLIGIPASESTDFSSLNNIIPQLSACFVNTSNLNDDCTTSLVTKLAKVTSDEDKLFITTPAISNEEHTAFDDLKFTTIENTNSRFIEDAAFNLSKYSHFE